MIMCRQNFPNSHSGPLQIFSVMTDDANGNSGTSDVAKRQKLSPQSNGSLRAVWAARSPSGDYVRLRNEDIKRLESALGARDQVPLKDSVSADIHSMTLTTPVSARTQRLARRLTRSDPPEETEIATSREFDGRCVFLNRLDGARPSPDTVSFSDVVGPVSEIHSVFACSFGTDFDWLQSQLNSIIPITLVDNPKDVGESKDNITVIYPTFHRTLHPLFRNGLMHAKLMLIRFNTNPSKLRLVITSANLIPFDWTSITQTVWVCDIHKDTSPPYPDSVSTFGTDLLEFIHSLIPNYSEFNTWMEAINKTVPPEFSLVASVPGTFYGSNLTKFGQMRLRSIIQSAPPCQVQYQLSSIGTLFSQFESEFIESVRASDLKIVFPTFEDAEKIDGKEHVFLKSDVAQVAKKYLAPLNRSPDRVHVLNHSKCIHADTWMYYGSHNLSLPSWGRFESDKMTFRIGSFELGFVVKKSPNLRLNVPWLIEENPQLMTSDPWMHDVYIQKKMREENLTSSPPKKPISGLCRGIEIIKEKNITLLCLDVDGTIVSSNTSDTLEEHAVSFLTQLDVSKIKIALVTNQGAVGLRHWMEVGKFGDPSTLPTRIEVEARLEKIKSQIESIVKIPIELFAAYRYQAKSSGRWCPVPVSAMTEARWNQEWRKPGPGMIREAMKWAKISPLIGLKNVLMVGDMDSDEGAAKSAGVKFERSDKFFSTVE
jgi:histidinol phosphatase-like enzyme